MITSRSFEECLLAALVCGGLVAVLASPVAGLVLGVMLAVAATTLTPCGCFVNWDAKRAMRAHDPAHARRLPVSIVTRHRQSPVPQPGRRGHLVVVPPHSGVAIRGTTAPAPITQIRFTPRS